MTATRSEALPIGAIAMQLPVRTREAVGEITIGFAQTISGDLIHEWNAALDDASTGAQRDAVEFLESTVGKWALYQRKGRLVRSAEELKARVEQDSTSESLGVLTASAEWYRNGALAGFCQFRRTWCNNVVFDFLGVHPSLIVPATREITGLGTALLYRLAVVARELKARRVWAETTDTSANFYASLFNRRTLADLLVIPAKTFYAPLRSAIESQQKLM